jgi:hypothetical protein
MKLFELSQAKSKAVAPKSERTRPPPHAPILATLFPSIKLFFYFSLKFFKKFLPKNILKKD